MFYNQDLFFNNQFYIIFLPVKLIILLAISLVYDSEVSSKISSDLLSFVIRCILQGKASIVGSFKVFSILNPFISENCISFKNLKGFIIESTFIIILSRDLSTVFVVYIINLRNIVITAKIDMTVIKVVNDITSPVESEVFNRIFIMIKSMIIINNQNKNNAILANMPSVIIILSFVSSILLLIIKLKLISITLILIW